MAYLPSNMCVHLFYCIPPGDIHGAGPLGTHGCAEIQAPVTPNTLDHYGGGGSSAGASGKGQQSSPKSKQRKKFDASIVGGVEEWRDNGTLYMEQVLLSCKDGWMDGFVYFLCLCSVYSRKLHYCLLLFLLHNIL